MKTINIKENIEAIDYVKREYDHLDKQVCLCFDQEKEEDFVVSYLYKDVLCQEDSWKFLMLAACSLVGLLDRNRIKAMIKWPSMIYVDDQKIAYVEVEDIIKQDFKGIVLTVHLNMNRSDDGICMKDITKKTYKKSIILTGLTAFLNIYDNLYHTHQFYKVLDYANDISYLKDKKVKDLQYGMISFIKLNSDGILDFIDDKGISHHQHIQEIKEI